MITREFFAMNSALVKIFLSCQFLISLVTSSSILDHNVQCDPKQMHVFFHFAQKFNGVIYAKGFHTKKPCRVYGNGKDKVSISLLLNVNSDQEPYCGVQLNSALHEFTANLIVNDAKDILVEGLQEFQVQCVYHLKDVTLQLPLQGGIRVGSPSSNLDQNTRLIKGAGDGILPVLDMGVRNGNGITGINVKDALIGQPLTLDIFLDQLVPYDIFIYNCIAHDGTRSPIGTVTLVDENGCAQHIDRVLNSPVQEEIDDRNLKHVFLNFRGFQFSTSEFVYFECQVRPCLDKCNATQCNPSNRLVPRSLSQLRQIGSALPKPTREDEALETVSVETKLTMHSQKALDQPVSLNSFSPAFLRRADPPHISAASYPQASPEFCLPHGAMATLVALFIVIAVFSCVAGLYSWKKFRSVTDEQTQKEENARP